MSSATEDAAQIRNLILQLFANATIEGDFKPETAHTFETEDGAIELLRGNHSLYSYSMLSKFPSYMVG